GWIGGGAGRGGISRAAMAALAAAVPVDGHGTAGEGIGESAATNPQVSSLVRRLVPEPEHSAQTYGGVSRRGGRVGQDRGNPQSRDRDLFGHGPQQPGAAANAGQVKRRRGRSGGAYRADARFGAPAVHFQLSLGRGYRRWKLRTANNSWPSW